MLPALILSGVSLAKREADVAVRATQSPLENLVGRRVGSIAQAVYGAASMFPGQAPPRRAEIEWVGLDETLWYPQLDAWVKKQGLDARCGYRADSMQAAVREAIGVTVLSCYAGGTDDRLVRLGEPIPDLATDLWLLTHPDLRRVVRVRTFTEFLGNAVHAREQRLAGA